MSNSNHDPKNKECLLNHLDTICFPSGNVRPVLHIDRDMNGKKFVCPYSVCTCPDQKTKCKCVEMSCKPGCEKSHTCHTYSCEKCGEQKEECPACNGDIHAKFTVIADFPLLCKKHKTQIDGHISKILSTPEQKEEVVHASGCAADLDGCYDGSCLSIPEQKEEWESPSNLQRIFSVDYVTACKIKDFIRTQIEAAWTCGHKEGYDDGYSSRGQDDEQDAKEEWDGPKSGYWIEFLKEHPLSESVHEIMTQIALAEERGRRATITAFVENIEKLDTFKDTWATTPLVRKIDLLAFADSLKGNNTQKS